VYIKFLHFFKYFNKIFILYSVPFFIQYNLLSASLIRGCIICSCLFFNLWLFFPATFYHFAINTRRSFIKSATKPGAFADCRWIYDTINIKIRTIKFTTLYNSSINILNLSFFGWCSIICLLTFLDFTKSFLLFLLFY